MRPNGVHKIHSSLSSAKPAKRAGYVEFFGEVVVSDHCGNSLNVVCDSDDRPNLVRITDGAGASWVISESSRRVNSRGMSEAFPIPLQSDLTSNVVDHLIMNGACGLTRYSRSAELHLLLLGEFLRAYNVERAEPVDLCPIT
jgi:hypothetical protein